MRIAVLSDIHGNIKALEAVLVQMNKQKIDVIWSLGDYVGYYYEPDEVLDRLQKLHAVMIQGNHERMLKKAYQDYNYAMQVYEKYGSGINCALQKLDSGKIGMLTSLPDRMTVCYENKVFHLCHGSPLDGDRYIYPDAEDSVFEECLLEEWDFVLMGHTHYPFIKTLKKTIFINPGSVGQSREFGGYASWVIINSSNWSIRFVQTPYDTRDLIKKSCEVDPHVPYLHEILVRGYDKVNQKETMHAL